MKPDLYFNVSKYISMFGAAAAAEVAAFEAANVLAVKELVETEGLDCDFHLTRAVDVYLDAEHAKEMEEAWRHLKEEDEVNLKDVAFIPQKDAERVSGFKSTNNGNSEICLGLWRQGRTMCVQFHRSTFVASENGAPATWKDT